MSYRLTDGQYAKLYNVTARTIRNWKGKSAPLDNSDPNAMALFKFRERSRRGVSKNNRRLTAFSSVPKSKTEPEPEEPEADDCLEQSLAELVDPILALQKKVRAEHPNIAAELMRIARITSYIFTITEAP